MISCLGNVTVPGFLSKKKSSSKKCDLALRIDRRTILFYVKADANFEVVDEGVYFIPLWGPDARTKIQFLSFATGKAEALGNVDRPIMWGFSISPDRKSILYVQGEYATGDLILLDNSR